MISMQMQQTPIEMDPFDMDWPWSRGIEKPLRPSLGERIDGAEALLDEAAVKEGLVQLGACYDALAEHRGEPGIAATSARLFLLTARAHASRGDRELAAELMELSLAVALESREPSAIAQAMFEGFTLRLAA